MPRAVAKDGKHGEVVGITINHPNVLYQLRTKKLVTKVESTDFQADDGAGLIWQVYDGGTKLNAEEVNKLIAQLD